MLSEAAGRGGIFHKVVRAMTVVQQVYEIDYLIS